MTRAFLTMGRLEPVAEAEVADALGEIANVLAGNVKALLPEHVEMTLPEVCRQSPSRDGARLNEVLLEWRGRPIVVSLHPPGLPVKGEEKLKVQRLTGPLMRLLGA